MLARLRTHGHEAWYHEVIRVCRDQGPLTLYLPYAPWVVECRNPATSVLVAATYADAVALLEAEAAAVGMGLGY